MTKDPAGRMTALPNTQQGADVDERQDSREPEISLFRPNRPGIRMVLGDLEAEIMELVWTVPLGEPITVRDIFAVLYERRRVAYTTVMNTMARLAKKRLLRVDRKEQAYLYYPTFSRDEFVSRFMGRILENLLVGFADETRASIEALPNSEAAARARQLLDEIAHRRAREEAD